jgi:hypothetical protein
MSQRGSEAMSNDRKSRPTSANGHSFKWGYLMAYFLSFLRNALVMGSSRSA